MVLQDLPIRSANLLVEELEGQRSLLGLNKFEYTCYNDYSSNNNSNDYKYNDNNSNNSNNSNDAILQ